MFFCLSFLVNTAAKTGLSDVSLCVTCLYIHVHLVCVYSLLNLSEHFSRSLLAQYHIIWQCLRTWTVANEVCLICRETQGLADRPFGNEPLHRPARPFAHWLARPLARKPSCLCCNYREGTLFCLFSLFLNPLADLSPFLASPLAILFRINIEYCSCQLFTHVLAFVA